MIGSKERVNDMRHRLGVLEIVEIAVRLYSKTGRTEFLNYARWFGNESRRLKEKIQGDYTQLDDERRRVDELINRSKFNHQ